MQKGQTQGLSADLREQQDILDDVVTITILTPKTLSTTDYSEAMTRRGRDGCNMILMKKERTLVIIHAECSIQLLEYN